MTSPTPLFTLIGPKAFSSHVSSRQVALYSRLCFLLNQSYVDGAHDNPHVSSELGSIRVHVASIKILNQSAKPKVYEVPDNMDGPVDEKSKKAQTHRTG
jgi:hypothetical protein